MCLYNWICMCSVSLSLTTVILKISTFSLNVYYFLLQIHLSFMIIVDSTSVQYSEMYWNIVMNTKESNVLTNTTYFNMYTFPFNFIIFSILSVFFGLFFYIKKIFAIYKHITTFIVQVATEVPPHIPPRNTSRIMVRH